MKSKTIKLFLFTFLMCLGSVGAWAQTKTLVYSNNFEDMSDFTRTGKDDGHEYNPDVSLANSFGSKIIGGGKASGDKGFMSPQFSIGDASIVDIDFKFKIDCCTGGKSSGIYITTGKNTSGWLNNISSVFSVKASASGNGYFSSITIAGEDVTSLLKITAGDYECKDLNRNTTGIVQLYLRLNFQSQKAIYSLSRIDGTVLVDNKTVDFESEASTIYGLFFCAGKGYGGVYIDDLNVYTVETADVLYERGTTTAWSETDLTEWIGNYGTIDISEGLKYTSPENGGGDYAKQLVTQDNSIIRVAATWNTGGSTGRSGNYNFLKCGDVEFRAYGQDQKGYIYIGSENILLTSTKNDVRDNAIWDIDLEINKATGAVNYSVKLPNEGTKKGTVYIANASFNELKIGFVRGGRTGTSTSTINAIEVTEELQTVATAEYTVKYIANGNEIKESVTKSGVIGAPVILENTDKENFFNDDKSMKYIYVSDDASEKIIAEDGSTIVTIAFREAETYNYTINAVDEEGKQLKVLKTGSNFEGETSRAYVPKGLNVDGVWYITSGNGSYPTYGYDFKEETTKDVTYIIDESVDYFFEVEDINTSRSWAARGAYPERYSNGLTGRLYQGAYAYTEALVGGVYTITMWARNNSSSAVANVGLYYRDSEGNAISLGVSFEDWTTGLSSSQTLENVIIPNGASLMLKNENPDYNSNLEMDYLILQKTGEIHIPLTLTSAGVGTICSPYNLDFTNAENIAAYKAETSEGKINLTRVYNVAAREGVLIRSLNGGAVTEDIPVSATAFDANEGNEFIGTLEDIASQPSEDAEYRYYILSSKTVNGNKVYGFYLANNKKIGAGKAYLRVPLAAAAKYSFFSFDDETTGIEDVELGITETDSPVYDLFGRKVVNPATGLYIKNGKKFIVK